MRVEPNRNVYVGHRYVPKIFGEWDNSNEYEGLSIVTHKGNSYTSKKRVPVGIDIENDEFWTVTGNYNAQVEYYRDDVNRYRDEVSGYKEDTEQKISNVRDYIDGEVEELTGYVDDEFEGFNTQLAQTTQDINQRGVNVTLPPFNISPNSNDDQSTKFEQAVLYAIENQLSLFIPPGEYFTTIKYRDGLIIEGAGVGKTILNLPNNANTHLISRHESVNIVNKLHIGNMTISGNRDNNTDKDVILLDSGTTDNNTGINLYNLMVRRSSRDGISITRAWEVFISNVIVGTCDNIGLNLSSSVTDSFVKNVIVKSCEGQGIKFSGSSCHFSDCKVFFSARLNGDIAGFDLDKAKRSTFVSCESQENFNGGFSLRDAELVSLMGCKADTNGITSKGDKQAPPKGDGYGFYIKDSRNTMLGGCYVYDFRSALFDTQTQFFGVVIEGLNNGLNVNINSQDQVEHIDYRNVQSTSSDLIMVNGEVHNTYLALNSYSRSSGIRINDNDGSLRLHKVASRETYDLSLYNSTGGLTAHMISLNKDNGIQFHGGKLGFFGWQPTERRTVSGTTDTEKINSLISALRQYGLIIDNT